MIKSIKVLLCGKNVIYCHFFDKIIRIPSGRIVVPSGRIAVPLMGGFLVLEGKSRTWHPGVRDGFEIRPFDVVCGDELSGC